MGSPSAPDASMDSRVAPPGSAIQVSAASARSASSVAAQKTGAAGTPVSRSIASASSRADSALDHV